MIYTITKFIIKIFYQLFYRIEIKGKENIPLGEGIIICPNHISNLDPPAISISIKEKMHFMAKDNLFKYKILEKIFRYYGAYPVKREKVDLKSIKHTIELLKNKNIVCIFIEGARQSNGKLGEGQPGVPMIALKTNSKILPVYISGYKIFRKTTITIGNPIDLSPYKTGKLSNDDYIKFAEIIMNKISI